MFDEVSSLASTRIIWAEGELMQRRRGRQDEQEQKEEAGTRENERESKDGPRRRAKRKIEGSSIASSE